MPFDGSGNYSPPSPPVFPAISGQTINSTYYNGVVNDIATALTNCMTRDGQGKPSANIDWNNKNLTNVNTFAATVSSSSTRLSLGNTTVTLSGAQTTAQKQLYSQSTYTGTTSTARPTFHEFNIEDSVASSITDMLLSNVRINHNVNADAEGNRATLHTTLTINGRTKALENGDLGDWNVAFFEGGSSTNQGGTGIGNQAFGALFGGNSNVILRNGATWWRELIGYEINVAVATGASANNKVGLQIVKTTSDAVTALMDNVAIKIADQSVAGGIGAAASWATGLDFGNEQAQWPFTTTSTLIRGVLSQNYTSKGSDANWGIDFNDVAFTTGLLRSKGISIDGDGQTRIGTAYINPTTIGVEVDVAGSIGTAVALASGGSDYNLYDGNIQVLRDAYGGVYKVTGSAAGVITAISMYRAPTVKGTTPANPVALTTDSARSASGSGATINITWSTRKVLILNPSGPTGLKEIAAADIPTPAATYQYLFIDTADHKLKRKDSGGTVTIIG